MPSRQRLMRAMRYQRASRVSANFELLTNSGHTWAAEQSRSTPSRTEGVCSHSAHTSRLSELARYYQALAKHVIQRRMQALHSCSQQSQHKHQIDNGAPWQQVPAHGSPQALTQRNTPTHKRQVSCAASNPVRRRGHQGKRQALCAKAQARRAPRSAHGFSGLYALALRPQQTPGHWALGLVRPAGAGCRSTGPPGALAAERIWSEALTQSSGPLPQRSTLGLYSLGIEASADPRALGPGFGAPGGRWVPKHRPAGRPGSRAHLVGGLDSVKWPPPSTLGLRALKPRRRGLSRPQGTGPWVWCARRALGAEARARRAPWQPSASGRRP